MINKKKLSFLYEMGLNEIQIKIYKYLLEHEFGGTIDDIKEDINAAFTTVSTHLKILEGKHLIESTKIEGKPKLFIKRNPKIGLKELLADNVNNFNNKIKELDEDIKIHESKYGRCLRDITFYHYSDANLALNNFYDLIEKTQREIILSTLPSTLVKKLAPSFYEAFMRGIRITIYYSLADLEEDLNYFEDILNIFRKIRVKIIEVKQKTCQVIRFNDEIVNMGHILIDENYLNALIFKGEEVFHCDGFLGPFAKQAKNYLEVLDIIKKWEIELPDTFNNVLKVIEKYKSIKTRDLSRKSKIGGAKLKEILEFLTNEGVIKEEEIKGEVGRPRRVYSIIE